MARLCWVQCCVCLIQLSLWSGIEGRPHSTNQSISDLDEVLCEIQTLDIEYAVGNMDGRFVAKSSSPTNLDESLVCQTLTFDNDVMQRYKISYTTMSNLRNGDTVRLHGKIQLDHTNALLLTTNATQWQIMSSLPPDKPVHRLLRVPSPVKLALVVRVTYLGREPSLSASQLRGRIFGRGSHRVTNSLRSQLEGCSHGQYRVRVPPPQNDISGGVMEVTISRSVAGSADSVLVLENLVVAQVTRRLSSEPWFHRLSHIMIVLPQHNHIRIGNDPNYVAYGYIGGTVTVFRNTWVGKLSVLQHEIGHNLGLKHSGRYGNDYLDMTGVMGYGVDRINGPRMCFNAQKHYATQWYSPRHLFAPMDLPYQGWLAFFGHVDKTQTNEPVIMALQVPGPQRFFLQYNLARGINAGTLSGKNAVTIVRDEASLGDTDGMQSWWVGAMSQTEPGYPRIVRYPVARLQGDLVFVVCNTEIVDGPPAKVHVSIFLDDGTIPPLSTCAPSLPMYCDDDMYATFQVNGQDRNCGWLKRQKLTRDNASTNALWQRICADTTHDGYQACRETCGACRDDCHDATVGRFWVNAKLGWQNCEWLSSRVAWQEQLCVVGHDAFRLCAESCNRCD